MVCLFLLERKAEEQYIAETKYKTRQLYVDTPSTIDKQNLSYKHNLLLLRGFNRGVSLQLSYDKIVALFGFVKIDLFSSGELHREHN